MATNSASVKFSTNIPEIVSLAFSEGKPVQSDYSGDQVMFSLTDGRKMYVAPFVADKIRAAGIRAHQPFEICKREVTEGNRRKIEFQIRPLQEDGRSPQPKPAAATHQSLDNTQGINSRDLTVGRVIPAQGPDLTGALEASIAAAAARKAQDAPAEQQPITPAQAKLLAALCVAIDSCVEAKAYAQRRGMPLEFTGEDVRCFANTILINAERGAR